MKIKNYDDYYITKSGNVYSMKTRKFLSPGSNGHGYMTLGLLKNGIRTPYKIHRLVAEHFIPNPNKLETVDHIDFNKLNNHISNLQWMSRNDNICKSFDISVRCIETDIIYKSQCEAARQTGVCQGGISKCCRGINKSAGDYHWEFV